MNSIGTALRPCWRKIGLLTALALAFAAPAGSAAGPSQQSRFLEQVAVAYVHYRGAYSYLRTGNAALAALEIEQAQDRWRAVMSDFESRPPDGFAADPLWRDTLSEVAAALDDALAETDAGDLEAARGTLAPVRHKLADLRRRNSVTTFSDRIDEISGAMERLWRYRHAPPDFASPDKARQLGSAAAVFAYVLNRAKQAAPPALAESAEFQRLIAGALEGTDRLWLALERKDQALLINTLRELRSFEQILFLKFG